MNVITVTLNIDPVFVATHHLARLALLMVVAPVFLKVFTKWGERPGSGKTRRVED